MGERITYSSDGLKLSGILATPTNPGGSRVPGVVLVPGFMSTADAFFPGFAEALNAAGFVSLTLDFRGFGESEGVRGEVIPYLQIYDASNAISYLQSRPEVNPDQIALLGVSLGGGEVAYIQLATDESSVWPQWSWSVMASGECDDFEPSRSGTRSCKRFKRTGYTGF